MQTRQHKTESRRPKAEFECRALTGHYDFFNSGNPTMPPPIPSSQLQHSLAAQSMAHPPQPPSYPPQQLGGSSILPMQMFTQTTNTQPGIGFSHCFIVPFTYIPGPSREDVLLATDGAAERWLPPEDAPPDFPSYRLPIHQQNIEMLNDICAKVSDGHIEATTEVKYQGYRKVGFSSRRKPNDIAVCVYITGSNDSVMHVRGVVMKSVPVALVRPFPLYGLHVFVASLIRKHNC